MGLTDSQWAFWEGCLPTDLVRRDGHGRPWSDRRKTLNGILWMLRTVAPWEDLPRRYGTPATVHQRFQRWREEGTVQGELEEDLFGWRGRGKLACHRNTLAVDHHHSLRSLAALGLAEAAAPFSPV